MYACTHITCTCIYLYLHIYIRMCIFMEIYQMIHFPDRTSVTQQHCIQCCSRVPSVTQLHTMLLYTVLFTCAYAFVDVSCV